MAKQVNVGLQSYLKQIRNIPLLTAEREKELATLIAAGDEGAREELISANLRLVLLAAKHYNQNHSISFEDLVQEGNLGLIRATKDFDASRGFRFSTYAMYWIKQAMSRAILNNSRTIRVPVHILELQTKYKRAQNELRDALGRKASAEEIAKHLQVDLKKIREIETLVKDPISLSTPLNDEDEGTVEDLVADESIVAPDNKLDNERLVAVLGKVLPTLSEREQTVITARFGLDKKAPRTLEELGKELGVSKERIRQIEQDALKKLRNPRRADQLKAYLN